LTVREVAIPKEASIAREAEGSSWLPKLTAAIEWVRADHGLVACVSLPPPDEPRTAKRKIRREREKVLEPVRRAALAELAKASTEQVRWTPGVEWRVQVRTEPCEKIESSP